MAGKTHAQQRSPSLLRSYASAGLESVSELLWPTRCVICEAPGELVCSRCQLSLPYIDQCLACPVCAAPNGLYQCTECNDLSLADAGLNKLPFAACVSAVLFESESACIVRGCKDAGEAGLAKFMGFCIACALPSAWLAGPCLLTSVPATAKAQRRRGFDHAELIGRATAAYLKLDYEKLLEPGRAQDQRKLDRAGRFGNVAGRFGALGRLAPINYILVDDVCTTGATLASAAQALLDGGAACVRCATFARVY